MDSGGTPKQPSHHTLVTWPCKQTKAALRLHFPPLWLATPQGSCIWLSWSLAASEALSCSYYEYTRLTYQQSSWDLSEWANHCRSPFCPQCGMHPSDLIVTDGLHRAYLWRPSRLLQLTFHGMICSTCVWWTRSSRRRYLVVSLGLSLYLSTPISTLCPATTSRKSLCRPAKEKAERMTRVRARRWLPTKVYGLTSPGFWQTVLNLLHHRTCCRWEQAHLWRHVNLQGMGTAHQAICHVLWGRWR